MKSVQYASSSYIFTRAVLHLWYIHCLYKSCITPVIYSLSLQELYYTCDIFIVFTRAALHLWYIHCLYKSCITPVIYSLSNRCQIWAETVRVWRHVIPCFGGQCGMPRCNLCSAQYNYSTTRKMRVCRQNLLILCTVTYHKYHQAYLVL